MTTYTVSIGNSDDKLTRAEWVEFIDGLASLLGGAKADIHFFGYSNPAQRWQSCTAVFTGPAGETNLDDWEEALEANLGDLARWNRQDAIAFTKGTTVMLGPTE